VKIKDVGWRWQPQLVQAQAQTDKIQLGPIFGGIDNSTALSQIFQQTLLILRHRGFRNQSLEPALEEAARLICYGITVGILVNGEFCSGSHPAPPPPHGLNNPWIMSSIQGSKLKKIP